MKKTWIFSTAVLALAATLSLMPMRAVAQTLRGDFDMNGQVNINDLTSLINCLLTDSPGEPEPGDYDTITVNGVPFVMVRVEGGIYRRKMGVHVSVETFSIGQTEVTRELWTAVMGDDDPPFGGPDNPKRPVDAASLDDCLAFIDRLNEMTGLTFRLPSWDEWLYAATGGKYTLSYNYAGSNDLDQVAWYLNTVGNSLTARPVAQLAPNELHLYDMNGNVAEWSNEFYPLSDYGYTDQGELMGGSIISSQEQCYLNYSMVEKPCHERLYGRGFRLVL